MIRGTVRASGDNGFLCDAWGGGWYMTDATNMRCFGNKIVYSSGGFLGGPGSFSTLYASGATTLSNVLNISGGSSVTYTCYGLDSNGQITVHNNVTSVVGLQTFSKIQGGEFLVISDERGKTNIKAFADSNCLNIINAVQPKHFTHEHCHGQVKLGLIAQDVEAVFPNAVSKTKNRGHDDYRSLSSAQLISCLWGGIRALNAKYDDLLKRTRELAPDPRYAIPLQT
jgi:hypothetical protein